MKRYRPLVTSERETRQILNEGFRKGFILGAALTLLANLIILEVLL